MFTKANFDSNFYISSFLLLIVLLTSCASRPVLYPNQKYRYVGPDQADWDIEHCIDLSDRFVSSRWYRHGRVWRNTAEGAMVGGSLGANSSWLYGDNYWQGAGYGGLLGSSGKGTYHAISPDLVKQRYVNHCMAKKGYQVIGWD